MITVDQFRTGKGGDRIYLDAHVNASSYFKDIHIADIFLMTGEQVKEYGTSSVEEHYIYRYADTLKNNGQDEGTDASSENAEESLKEIHLALSVNDLNEYFSKGTLSDDLFFVFIKAEGTPGTCTPCGLDNQYTVAVTFDNALLYGKAMGYLKQLGGECAVPKDLYNFIMLSHALKYAVETSHWIPAVEYFELLKGGGNTVTTATSPCPCH